MPGLALSTKMVDPKHRMDFWRELCRPLFDVLPAEEESNSLEGSVHAHRMGELILASVRFDQQQYNKRDRQLILGSGLEHYLVQVTISGSMTADFDGVSLLMRPGDIWLFDLARPYRCNAEAGSRITIAVPRNAIDRANSGRSAHGLVLPGTDPLTGLLRKYLIDLQEMTGSLPPEDRRAMELVTVDFIASVMSRRLERQGRQSTSADRTRQRMLEFIDAHISDPKLGPDLLMRHFQMSRAHLYRFFAELGGVTAVIRKRRLDAAYRMLKDPSAGRRTITEVALDLGFASSSHFTRAFAGHFAVPPSRLHPDIWPSSEETEVRRLHAHLEAQVQNWKERARNSPTSFSYADHMIVPGIRSKIR